jgi:thiol-disulfide isomerase/thioredoxin
MLRRPACLAVALALFLTCTARAADVPRYQLPVGRVLIYSGESASKDRNPNIPPSSSKSNWRFTVVAQNPDGSARVLVRSATTYTSQGRESPERVSSAVIDLFPDGRYRIDRDLAMILSPETVFPRLPADADQAAKQWQSDVNWSGTRYTFAPQAAGGEGFAFTGVQEGVTNRIYLMTRKSTFHLDPSKGMVTRVEIENSQDWGFHSKGTGTLKLDKEETLPAEQAQTLARDYATYTQAVKAYDAQMKTLLEHPDKAQETIDAAQHTLTAAAGQVQHPDVKQEFKDKLEEHEMYAKYSIEQAKRLAEVLNKPAPDWSAKDLNDHPVSAQSLRGKVVVMDFWYRGCGWCMYAMPEVKRLANDFKDKGVVVLGMNTDENLDDARVVIKELALDYPQVQAAGLPEKFGVQGFPTLIIIDQQGNVKDVHVGYSPDLYETVSKKLQSLLTPNAAG